MKESVLLFLLPIWPIAGGIISYLIGKRNKQARNTFTVIVCAVEFALFLVMVPQVLSGQVPAFTFDRFCGLGIALRMDGFRLLYGGIAALMWLMTTLFSGEYFAHYHNRNRYYLFLLMTFGATTGVFLSADLFTTFIFFEMMSVASYVMVAQEETPSALRAGDTYLAVAIIGGMVMLMGLFLLYDALGTLRMSELAEAAAAYGSKTRIYVAAFLMLFGFGAKAGMFPLHIWLPKAHPVAPAPASALLSGILTKTGIFGVLVISSTILLHDATWGMVILCFGLVTMFLGALLAVFSIDLKRTLACSSVSQIGFILVGIGMQGLLGHHNSLAVRGTLLHMVNHSLLKLVLFMAAGVVYMNLHRLDLNEIRGFGRKKPLLHFVFLMGYLGIIGMPLWNGYISKTLLHESIVEYMHEFAHAGAVSGFFHASEIIFLVSGGLTAAYMTKLYICLFWEKGKNADASAHGRYMNKKSAAALLISSLLLPVLGMMSSVVTDRIATLGQGFMHGADPEHPVKYFIWTNLKGSVISLAIGAAVYLLIIRPLLMKKEADGTRTYVNRWPAFLDLEELIYRPLLLKILPGIGGFVAGILSRVGDLFIYIGGKTVPSEEKEIHDYKEYSFMQEDTDTITLIKEVINSFSFSLLLLGIGLVVVLIYVLRF